MNFLRREIMPQDLRTFGATQLKGEGVLKFVVDTH